MPGNSKIRVYCVFWVLKKALLSKPDFSDAFGRLNELDNLTARTGHCRAKTTSPCLQEQIGIGLKTWVWWYMPVVQILRRLTRKH